MRLIDADKLTRPEILSKYYHLPNGDIAIPIIDIEHASTIDAAPVVNGRWMKLSFDNTKLIPVPWDDMNEGCPEGSCLCSVCGDWLTGSDEYPAKGLYCPNCGAKMDFAE